MKFPNINQQRNFLFYDGVSDERRRGDAVRFQKKTTRPS